MGEGWRKSRDDDDVRWLATGFYSREESDEDDDEDVEDEEEDDDEDDQGDNGDDGYSEHALWIKAA